MVAMEKNPTCDSGRGSGALSWEEQLYLKDGRSILVRLLGPHDKPALKIGIERLSQQSLYFRFFRPVKSLSDSELDDLTQVDQVDHLALVALTPTAETVGVARCIRLSQEEPTVGELAITVIDHYQRLGLGSHLLRLLGRLAAQRGMETLRAWVHSDNVSMLRLLSLSGAVRVEDDGYAFRLELPSLRPPG